MTTPAAPAAEGAIAEPDPLGRDRCANCLYDRRGILADAPCPECGYRLPEGTTVLTLRRQPVHVWQIVVLAVFVGVIVFGNTRGGRSAVTWLPYAAIGGILSVLAVSQAVRSRQGDVEYVSQVWLSSAGIGLEPFADRFGSTRNLERAGMAAIRLLPLAMMVWVPLQTAGSAPRAAYAAAGCFAVVAGTIAWIVTWSARRARAPAPAPDAVAPPIVRWDRVRSIDVKPRRGGHATMFLRLSGFWAAAAPRAIGFAADASFAARVESCIYAARSTATRRPGPASDTIGG